METAAKIRKADIARHWGVSPAYVTQVLKRHPRPDGSAPEFATLEEADAWRAENAPAKPANEVQRQSSIQNPVEAPKKSRLSQAQAPRQREGETEAAATTTAAASGGDGLPANNGGGCGRNDGWGEGRGGNRGGMGGERIDVREFIQPGGDFVSIMLKQSEEVPQVAYGLYLRACGQGNPAAVSVASGNWAEAARNAAQVRERYLDLQERERNLIPLDLVMDIVGTELQALRSFLLSLGDRYGAKANPENPGLGKAAIEEGVDEIMKSMEALPQRVAGETETRAAEAAAA